MGVEARKTRAYVELGAFCVAVAMITRDERDTTKKKIEARRSLCRTCPSVGVLGVSQCQSMGVNSTVGRQSF